MVTMLLVTGGWGERAKVVHICLNLPFQLLFHSPWSSFYANSQRKPQIRKQKYSQISFGWGAQLASVDYLLECANGQVHCSSAVCKYEFCFVQIWAVFYTNINFALYKYEHHCIKYECPYIHWPLHQHHRTYLHSAVQIVKLQIFNKHQDTQLCFFALTVFLIVNC